MQLGSLQYPHNPMKGASGTSTSSRSLRGPTTTRCATSTSTALATCATAQQQPARQTVAASSCYVAVGRDSDKYHAVRSMLNDLLKLADHYLTWRRRTRPVSMTRREELEHRAATHCRECLASFETAEKKLHHCHGAGQYLGALCHSCNIAAQTPKTIPVVFHNGGGYDFHFLPVSRAPREELGEDSDNEGTESEAEGSEPERPMPMAKAAPKPKAHTDVLALADVMESYRDSFRAQSGLDPIHYVTLPGAAWDAMLRHSAPFTSSPTSRPTRTCGPPSWAG